MLAVNVVHKLTAQAAFLILQRWKQQAHERVQEYLVQNPSFLCTYLWQNYSTDGQ